MGISSAEIHESWPLNSRSILSEQFYIFPSSKLFKNKPCDVRLSSTHLKYKILNEVSTGTSDAGTGDFWESKGYDANLVKIADIVGCHVMRNYASTNSKSTDESAYLSIYSYPLVLKNKFGIRYKKSKRGRRIFNFKISKCETFEENSDIAHKWKRTILWFSQNRISNVAQAYEIINIPSTSFPHRNLLVFINPVSGSGKALEIFRKNLAPVLGEAEINFKVMISKSANSVSNYVKKKLDINSWDGIVIVSGDGLVYELINGLMQRHDWEKAIKIPIGVIPGGSGNALVHSILHAIGELSTNIALSSALNIVKGKYLPLDLAKVSTANGNYYSFLSIGWGLMADIDIESERLRLVGGARFAIWSVIRTMALRKYSARLSYLPNIKQHNFTTKDYNSSQSTADRSERKLIQCRSQSMPICDTSSLDDSDQSNGNIEFSCEEISNIENIQENGNTINEEYLLSNSNFPSLNEKIPNNWTVIDDEFICVYTIQQTHIGGDGILAPEAKFDDGVIWLLYILGDVTRTQIIQFLASIETGSHINLPYITLIPVRGLRLEPRDNKGRITIDGELIECGPIQAEVLPSLARIMTR